MWTPPGSTPKIQAQYDVFTDEVALRGVFVMADGSLNIWQPVMCYSAPIGTSPIVNPFISLRKRAAVELMDELWRCGIRPSFDKPAEPVEPVASDGSALAATQAHIESLRTLLFHEVGITTPVRTRVARKR